MVPVGPLVAVIVGFGVDEDVAVPGTSVAFVSPACKVAAMMVAAWSSTERVGSDAV
jgi:hypothetical protein